MLVVTLTFQSELKSPLRKNKASFFTCNKLCINYQYWSLFSLCSFAFIWQPSHSDVESTRATFCGQELDSVNTRERFGHQLTSKDPREQVCRDLVTLIKAANIFAMKTVQPHTKHSRTSRHSPGLSSSKQQFSCPGNSFALSLYHTSRQGEETKSHLTVYLLPSHSSPSFPELSKTQAKLLK